MYKEGSANTIMRPKLRIIIFTVLQNKLLSTFTRELLPWGTKLVGKPGQLHVYWTLPFKPVNTVTALMILS